MIRLNRYIASCGVCSRRKADELIQNGEIRVNDRTVLEPGIQVDPEKDRVFYRNKRLKPQEHTYFLFYKPPYVLSSCSRDPLYPDRKIITDFLPGNKRLFYVGRLDYDAEGLILLTNDGMTSQKLAHPRYEIEKKYRVLIDKKLSPDEIAYLQKGFSHEGSHIFMKNIEPVGTKSGRYEYLVVLTQGIKRQIKVMLDSINRRTLSIKRIAFGPLHLGDLKPGQFRPLSGKEKKELFRLAGK